MATWELAGTARRDFANMIESMTDEQRATQSLCGEWDSEGVVNHLTSFVEVGLPKFFMILAKSKFDFDKGSITLANTQADRSLDDKLGSLRAKATKSASMPTFPEGMTLSDVAIHTQDVRRPTGADGQLDDAVLRAALEFLTEHKLATTLVDRREIDGVKLVATDLDWSFGSGPEISGTGEAIMMGLANRPVLDELTGDGLAQWS